MEMLVISAPVVASMTSYTLMQLLDKWMVAHIGPDPVYVGAQGNGGMCSWVPISLAHGLITVVNTYVSQHLGAGRPDRAPAYAWAGGWICTAFYLLVLVPGAFVLPAIIGAVSGGVAVDDPVAVAERARFVAMASSYGQIMLLGSIATLWARTLGQFFYGLHRPGVVLVATVSGNILNFILNSFLIFGPVACVTGFAPLDAWFAFTARASEQMGIPRLEITGAALATVIAGGVELLIPLCVFLGPKYNALYATRRAWRRNLAQVREIFSIGWPGALMFGNEMVCWAVFMVAQVGHFGPRHSTAGWIAHQWMTLSFMPAVGISIAVTAMVGKAMGMGRPDLAAARAWLGVKVSVAYMSICAVCFVAFGPWLVGVFIDPGTPPEDRDQLLRLGTNFLIAAATFQFFDGIAMSLSGALRGAGDTRWVGLVTVILSWTLIVAGGWMMVYLAPGLGSVGPWITASAYVIVLALLVLGRFMRGKWKSIKLVEGGAAVAVGH